MKWSTWLEVLLKLHLQWVSRHAKSVSASIKLSFFVLSSRRMPPEQWVECEQPPHAIISTWLLSISLVIFIIATLSKNWTHWLSWMNIFSRWMAFVQHSESGDSVRCRQLCYAWLIASTWAKLKLEETRLFLSQTVSMEITLFSQLLSISTWLSFSHENLVWFESVCGLVATNVALNLKQQ